MKATVTEAIRTVIEGWRAATPRHFGYTFLFALAWAGVTIAAATGFTRPFPVTPALNSVLSMELNGFAVLFAVLVADRVSSPLARRPWPYAAAVLLGVAIGTTATWLISQPVLNLATAYGNVAPYEPFDSFAFRHGRHALVVCGLVTSVYVSARWAAERHRALSRVQLERVAAEKQLIESKLAATQSRVDPAALQATLARIDALYESDPAQADAVLRDLIAFLRATIPQNPFVRASAGPLLASPAMTALRSAR